MVEINYSFLQDAICSDSSITDKILAEVTKQLIKKTAEVVVKQTFETAPYVISYVGDTIKSNYTYYFGNEEPVKEELCGVTIEHDDHSGTIG
ncbi:MAG: hypothetical protein N4A31_02940 [Rickettsiales bacterium]|jgi:hypothetical protein|nr:hypothetical protein [Rickettsiales bacterium]